MKVNFSIALVSTLTFSMIMTGCNNHSSQSSLAVNQDKDIKISESSILTEKTDYGTDIKTGTGSENKKYAIFFTYPYEHGPEIEPGTGGTLVMKDGCLLILSGDRFDVPVFPHGITTWNENTQILTANGIDIPLNTEFFTNGPLEGGKYDPSYDYNFEQQANPKCLENRYIVFLGSQFMDATDLPNH